MELYLNSWHDDGDPEVLVYFQIVDNNRELWSSSWHDIWHDIREFVEDNNVLNDLRKEIQESCEKYNIVIDLSDNDYYDWCKTQKYITI